MKRIRQENARRGAQADREEHGPASRSTTRLAPHGPVGIIAAAPEVKHQPSTPLPWRIEGNRIRSTYTLSAAERAHYAKVFSREVEPGEKMDAVVGEGDDLAYKVHAANAYPKLVETMRAALTWARENKQRAGTLNVDQMSLLLADLGEYSE